jgi:FlaA1/EpsC-like NDP-sugar epimerase
MQRNTHLGMKVMGFLDDDPVKLGKSVYGTRVCGTTADLAASIQAFSRSTRSSSPCRRRPAAWCGASREDCRKAGVFSRTIPGVFELLDGQVSVSRLRQVDITDLLRRPTVDAGPEASSYVAGQDVLVTGAGGSIGFELCRQIAHSRPRRADPAGPRREQHLRGRQTAARRFSGVALVSIIADVRDRDRILRVFDRFHPDTVFHAAPTSTSR